MDIPETKYATLGDAQIAYQVFGEGPVDLVFSLGFNSNIDVWWDHPIATRFSEGLATFSRVIQFDRRGSGVSDPVPPEALPTWEEWAEDLRAVLDAVDSQRAAILAYADAGPVAMLFAATYPERTSALVLVHTAARYLAAEDYPCGITPEVAQRAYDFLRQNHATRRHVAQAAQSMAHDERFVRWHMKYARACMTPRAAAAQVQHAVTRDIRSVLPTIGVPTLILHRTKNRVVDVEHGRYLAARIPGAKLIELAGADTHIITEGAEETLGHIEEFLTGARPVLEPDRVLAAVLFTDIVGSTERAAGLGDRRWKELLHSHDTMARSVIEHHRGRLVKSTGDGVLATFDGPGRAIRCARALREALRTLGIEIRAGLHTGEVELTREDIGGIGVHVAARVLDHAMPGELLASGAVPLLVAGSGIEFADRGAHVFKGLPGEWRLFSVEEGTPSGVTRADRGNFRRENSYWALSFKGQGVRIRHVRGLSLIAELLRAPGRELHVSELAGTVLETGDAGPVLDAQAKASYRRRMVDLEEERAEAERNADLGRAEKAQAEIEVLADQLAGAVGLRGRDRRASSGAERLRLAVTKAIRRAIAQITAAHAELGHHLDRSIRTGYFCSYSPERPVAWML